MNSGDNYQKPERTWQEFAWCDHLSCQPSRVMRPGGNMSVLITDRESVAIAPTLGQINVMCLECFKKFLNGEPF